MKRRKGSGCDSVRSTDRARITLDDTLLAYGQNGGALRPEQGFNRMDFRVEKTFKLVGQSRVGLIVDLFNVTNSSTVIQRGIRTGVDLGVPRVVINPRSARLGARLTW